MNYTDIFRWIWSLLSSPSITWTRIKEDETTPQALTSFVYPLIALCGTAEFISIFLENGWERDFLQTALLKCTAAVIGLFGGFFFSTFVIEKMSVRLLGKDVSNQQVQQLVGYSMVVLLVLGIVKFIFPILVLHWIIKLYTVYIVFEGLRNYMEVSEEKLLKATVFVSLVVIVAPTLIQTLFNRLSA